MAVDCIGEKNGKPASITLCERRVADAIAIVCADTFENANAAAERVNVEPEEPPAYMSAPAAMKPDPIEIHPGTPNVYCEKQGVGVSIGTYGCGLDGPDSSGIWVERTQEGVTVGTSWEDHGHGANIGALATAHKALEPWGIAPDKIKLVMCDTALTPNSGPLGGSRQQADYSAELAWKHDRRQLQIAATVLEGSGAPDVENILWALNGIPVVDSSVREGKFTISVTVREGTPDPLNGSTKRTIADKRS